MAEYKIGDIVEGKVTGVQPYGAFVSLDGTHGLIHISEITNAFVQNIHDHVQEGQTVRVKIIDIEEDNKFSLSLRALESDKGREKPFSKEEEAQGFNILKDKLKDWIRQSQ